MRTVIIASIASAGQANPLHCRRWLLTPQSTVHLEQRETSRVRFGYGVYCAANISVAAHGPDGRENSRFLASIVKGHLRYKLGLSQHEERTPTQHNRVGEEWSRSGQEHCPFPQWCNDLNDLADGSAQG